MFNTVVLTMCVLFINQVASAADGKCTPTNYQELIKCAETQSLEVQINNQNLDAASELEGVASQFVNPELDLESIRKDADKSETTASLMFNISLGGKRSSLKAEAKAEREKTVAETELNTAQLRLELMTQLYRLKHLEAEIAIEEESSTTFNKIISQFSRRAALTPEQEVSASIFKMSVSDHQLSLTKLKNEQAEVLANLVRQTGLPKELVLKNLPARKESWPDVGLNSPSTQKSPHLRFAEADLELAKSQKDKAVAESWPDLTIGPVFKEQKDGALTENFSGVGLSMPLPIFSLNGSARAYQSKKVLAAELNLQNEASKITSLR